MPFVHLASGASGNADFGDWNAFEDVQPANPPVNPPTAAMFAPAPASTVPSADLFDLMGSSLSTNISASQSINFSMTSTQNTGLPISQSQVCVTSVLLFHCHVLKLTKLFFLCFYLSQMNFSLIFA